MATPSPDPRRKNPCLLDFQSCLHAPSDGELTLSLGKLRPHHTGKPVKPLISGAAPAPAPGHLAEAPGQTCKANRIP